ncbi:MAG: hypothetical protein ACLPTF_16620 [Steroidobacteraceae bacterium]
MNIAHQGTRPKLTLTPKPAPVSHSMNVGNPGGPLPSYLEPAPMPADQVAAITRRAESCAVPLENFYLVWAPSRKRPPKYRHAALEAAQAEAARLATLNPGTGYFVYRCEQVST